ncbi:alpha-amylase family protein [Paenibacillus agricola]|uniref:Family 10 glycosylhydrolase n=1 Tax=Paenibacillus agricola TaxID=2716264 RepID=A0ABX0JC64_9BACL|nr:alpha-amylase family protein [Paenibacillus agricola]NHN32965.1 family 10 glycosylhydrolase [Paenibacillus agricola]
MAWWEHNNLRLIQNNLRETDANLDVDLLIEELNKLSTNVLMMNAGGIVAFYPTELEYHYRAAGQTKDLLKEAITKAHANGMKFIARFDFSKAHETIFAKHPEWFYRTRKGKEVNYHGIVHTCINGYYQREYSLQMIDEVISNYDVDGIFFNMFGYQTRDYSGHHYGICFCDSCKAAFLEYSGSELPLTEQLNDAVFRTYKQFQDATTKTMLDRIHTLVRSKGKDIAISTYNEHKVDIVRKESNTDKERPQPVWLYSASENVKSLEDSWDDRLISNCCINAIDLIHRFTGVSKYEMGIRLNESLASGSGLDFCIIGVFEDYPDNENLTTVADIFKYHKDNEAYYGKFLSMADVALIKPGGPAAGSSKEYHGIFKMLKEQHIQFDVLHQNNLVRALANHGLTRYKAILIPNTASLSEEGLQVLEDAYAQGVSLISTGLSFTDNEAGQSFLQRVFDVKINNSSVLSREAAYLKTEDKALFRSFAERDWVFLDGAFPEVTFGTQTIKKLPYVIPSTFGPPERASGHRISDHRFGAGIRSAAGSSHKAIYLPWLPGELYYQHGFADHKHIILDLLEHTIGQPQLLTNAPQNVEIFLNKLDEYTYILHLLNVSGFNGVTYFEPLPVYDLKVTINGIGSATELIALTNRTEAALSAESSNSLTIELQKLSDFAAIVIKV